MVLNPRKAESSNPSEKAEKLVDALVQGFEESMNNDLDVKGAFDCLFGVVSKLDVFRKQNRLSNQDAKSALDALERVDRVLRFIF